LVAESLWANRAFVTLWAGQSVSEVGSAVSSIAIPLLAVTTLSASAFQVAVLTGLGGLAVLLGAGPAGYLADRASWRVVLCVCDVGRVFLVGSIPVAAAAGWLHLSQIYVVAFAGNALTVIFGVVYHSYYPALVQIGQLTDANSKIATTESLARVARPALGGALIGAVGAVRTVTVDALSYLASVIAVLRIPATAQPAKPRPERGSRRVLSDGLDVIRSDATLTRLVVSLLIGMFSLAMSSSIVVVYLVDNLHMSGVLVAVSVAIGEAGGCAAAITATTLTRRFGVARVLIASSALTPVGYLLLAATPTSAMPLSTVVMAASSARFVLFDIVQYSYRQAVCPPHRLGRLTATIRLGAGAVTMSGALAAAACSLLWGTRGTLAVAATILCASAAPLWISSPRS